MLLSLQGITHQVHTGVGVVLFPAGGDDASSASASASSGRGGGGGEYVVRSFSETTKVTFASLDEGEIKARRGGGDSRFNLELFIIHHFALSLD